MQHIINDLDGVQQHNVLHIIVFAVIFVIVAATVASGLLTRPKTRFDQLKAKSLESFWNIDQVMMETFAVQK